jgi:hypothetical protein
MLYDKDKFIEQEVTEPTPRYTVYTVFHERSIARKVDSYSSDVEVSCFHGTQCFIAVLKNHPEFESTLWQLKLIHIFKPHSYHPPIYT